ncbi:MAG: guanylate kinase [Bacteroidota bacterium]
MNHQLILFCGPSGSGKTTVVHSLLEKFPQFIFSVSATTRPQRINEKDGVDYYFLSEEEFREKIKKEEFLEWEEVYPGRFYGTLKEEVNRKLEQGHIVLFDVDVKGGLSVKKYFGKQVMDVFIMPPSLTVLKQRLEARESETQESLEKRLAKSGLELSFADQFSYIIVNDELQKTIREAELLVNDFINRKPA